MNKRGMQLCRLALAFVAIGFASAISATSAALPIFSGPAYDAATGNGYQTDSLPHGSGNAAGEAVGVGNTEKYVNGVDLGARAMTWTDSAILELGGLGADSNGAFNTRVQGVSATGRVSGKANKYVGGVDLGYRAVRWEPGSSVAIELGHIGTNAAGYTNASALAMNDAGASVGVAESYSGSSLRGTRAVRWDANSTIATELGHLGLSSPSNGETTSYAYAINANGSVVGEANLWSGGSDRGPRPVRWDAGSTVATALDILQTTSNGDSYGYVADINDPGVSVGAVTKYTSGTNRGLRAVRWDANSTVVADLGLLGDGSGTGDSRAYDINNAGVTIGYAQKFIGGNNRGRRAARWSPGSTTAIELDSLNIPSNVQASTTAFANNDLGITVGYSDKYVGGSNVGERAVYWSEDGAVHEIGALLPEDSGWVSLTQALALTEAGWISGWGMFDPDGVGSAAAYQRMFLILVPQAGTYGRGDANFDGHVNFDDLLILSQNYGESNASQSVRVGDFDLNGIVDFGDLLALAQHYESGAMIDPSSLGSTFSADWALARSMVPEPIAGLTIAATMTGMRRRRAIFR